MKQAAGSGLRDPNGLPPPVTSTVLAQINTGLAPLTRQGRVPGTEVIPSPAAQATSL